MPFFLFRYPAFTTYERLSQFCGKAKKHGHPTPEFMSYLRKCMEHKDTMPTFATAIKIENDNITECFEFMKREKKELLKHGINLFVINVIKVTVLNIYSYFLC